MNITLNGSSVADAVAEGATTLQDVLNGLYARTEASRHVITEIVVNGRLLDGDDEARLSAMAANHISSIGITTTTFHAFLSEQSAGLLEKLERLSAEGRRATASFLDGHVREAVEQLQGMVEEATLVIRALGIANGSFIYWDYISGAPDSSDVVPVDPRVEVCCAVLGKAADAVAAQDRDRFSSLMRGEWSALIEAWTRELRQRMTAVES